MLVLVLVIENYRNCYFDFDYDYEHEHEHEHDYDWKGAPSEKEGYMAKNTSLSKSEKLLLFYTSAFIVIVLAAMLWLQGMNTNPVVNIPTPVMPSPNARDSYLKALTAFVPYQIPTSRGTYSLTFSTIENQYYRQGPMSDPNFGKGPGIAASHGERKNGKDPQPSLAELQALSRLNAPALAALRVGFNYDYHGTPERSFTTLFPEYSQFRELARDLAIDAQIKRMSGDWQGAANDSLDCIRFGSDTPRGSIMIGLLVGIAIQAIGRSGLEQAIDHLDATSARAAARRLEDVDRRHTAFADVLQEEEWGTQASLLELFQRADWRHESVAPIRRGESIVPRHGEDVHLQQRPAPQRLH